MPKIVVVGSINTDMVIRTPQIPIPGQTVIGTSFAISGGGKGANQAVAAARLGGEVTLVAKVGDDTFGQQAVENFRRENINISYIGIDPVEPSGVALITIDENGENVIVVAPGANSSLSVADVLAAESEIAGADVVLFQLETPLETVLAGLKLARKYKTRTILNPAPAQSLENEMYHYLDIITPNQMEALFLTDLLVETSTNAVEAAEWIHRKGVPVVIITMGELGSYVSSNEAILTVPAQKVEKVIDTVAAGDTFCGALAVALGEGRRLVEAVGFASRAAALSVTRSGSQASIPYRWEVEN